MSYGIAIEENPALADESLIPMQEAGAEFPVKISRACLERLIRKGTRGIKLETLFFANRRYTSKEAIRRFIERTQNVQDKKTIAPTASSSKPVTMARYSPMIRSYSSRLALLPYFPK